MLTNLGYEQHSAESDNVKGLQADFGLEQTGEIDDIKDLLQKWHDSGEAPPVQEAGDELGEDAEGAAGGEELGDEEDGENE